jgi:hypothetical protein
MKVCNRCGVEIDTRDGDNMCDNCTNRPTKHRTKRIREEREMFMQALGLTKAKGALGGTYWE